MSSAVFLDRDDTLIIDRNYLADVAGVTLLPGAASAVRELNERGIPVVLITNQSGIARGYLDETRLREIHEHLEDLLVAQGAHLDGIYYCPHHPEGTVAEYSKRCSCRKPQPGMLQQAARDFQLDLAQCYMVGDKPIDIETIHRVGGRGILVGPEDADPVNPHPDYRAADLTEAVRWILQDMTT